MRASTALIMASITLIAISTSSLAAQEHSARRPIPYPVIPSSQFQRAVEQGTRTTSGEPGPNYWQQWTDYVLTARLDVERKELMGTAQIEYHNRAPSDLRILAVHLLQNMHAEGAQRNEPAEITGGIDLQRVAIGGTEIREMTGPGQGAGYGVDGTVMYVRLAEPLRSGRSVTLSIDWTFKIPQAGAGARMGWSRDDLFFIAYWYPHMAVYDDVVGYQVDRFLSNAEFYAGFGSYDVTIQVPEGWIVMGTGTLQNADQVLSEPVFERYERAFQSDDVVHVLTADDFGTGRATLSSDNGILAWRFHADSVRDVAFSVTRQSMWDAARTPVGDRDGDGETDYALINSFYRELAPRWRQTWRYAQHSIDFLSRWTGISYPWPHMTAVEGAEIMTGGMEFPMMTLIGDYNERGDSALYFVTAHELAHMWVPMIVNVDEKRHAWMDEGTTSFNENQARKEFYPGPNHDAPDRENYLNVARAGAEGELMRRSDYHYPGPAYGTASYSKPATLLATLRAVLGEETFVRAYQTYLRNWASKHPKPWDFFNTFNSVSGQDLDWFWRSWYYETWTLDHAVSNVQAGSNGAATITIQDYGLAPMPARVTITRQNGDTEILEVPVETWLNGNTVAHLEVSAGSPVVRVEIDAAEELPDIDRRNNVWDRGRSE